MQPISKVNPATDQGKTPGRSNMAEDLSKSSPEEFGEKETNSALTRTPSEGQPNYGSDREFHLRGEPTERLHDVASRAKDIAWRVSDKAQKVGKQTMEKTGSYVKEHPAYTVAGCFGLGLVLGFLIGRR